MTTEYTKDSIIVISVFAIVALVHWLYGLDFERSPELVVAFVIAVFVSLGAMCSRRGV